MGSNKSRANDAKKNKQFDLNWLLANSDFSLVTSVHGFLSSTIIRCAARYLYGATRSMLFCFKAGKAREGSIVFFTSSNNQFQALDPVAKLLDNACIVEMVNPFSKAAKVFFPLHRAYFKSIPDFIAFAWKYKKHTTFEKLVIKSRGDLLALAPALESVAINFLKASKPAAIVVANDTVVWCRAVLAAARSLGIPTVLLQHAPVSNTVPPLEVDFAFLDGSDAATKYRNAGIDAQCTIYLSGGPRQDPFRHSTKAKHQAANTECHDNGVKVGVCVNMVDDLDQTNTLLQQILTAPSISSVALRCHPQDKRKKKFSQLAQSLNISYSPNNSESPQEFINSVDLLIAGDSSMLLDAVMSNTKAVKSELLGIDPDFLGLIDAGLVARVDGSANLEKCIESTKHWQGPALKPLQKYYCVAGTKHDGQSRQLVATELSKLANNIPSDPATWIAREFPQQLHLKK